MAVKGFISAKRSSHNLGEVRRVIISIRPDKQPPGGGGSDYTIHFAPLGDGGYKLLEIHEEDNRAGMGGQGGPIWRAGDTADEAVQKFLRVFSIIRE